MPELLSLITFILLLVLGTILVTLCYLNYRNSGIDKISEFLKYKFIVIVFFVTGILVHNLGNVTGRIIVLETVGHIIIMIGAIVLIKQAIEIKKVAEDHGYV